MEGGRDGEEGRVMGGEGGGMGGEWQVGGMGGRREGREEG